MNSSMPLPKKIALAGCLILLAASVWFFFFRTGEDDAIRKRIREFAEAASYSNPAQKTKSSVINLKNVSASHSIGDYVSEKITFQVKSCRTRGGYDYTGVFSTRSELISTYLLARSACSSLEFSVSDFSVTFTDESRCTAQVNFIASCKGKTEDGDYFSEVQAVETVISLEEDGKWRLISAQSAPLPAPETIRQFIED